MDWHLKQMRKQFYAMLFMDDDDVIIASGMGSIVGRVLIKDKINRSRIKDALHVSKLQFFCSQ